MGNSLYFDDNQISNVTTQYNMLNVHGLHVKLWLDFWSKNELNHKRVSKKMYVYQNI